MVKLRNILLLLMLVALPLSATATTWSGFSDDPIIVSEDAVNLEITINNETKVQLLDVPTTGYLEIYSILGLKVRSISLKSYLGEGLYVSLPKGIYIVKAGRVSKKVIVR